MFVPGAELNVKAMRIGFCSKFMETPDAEYRWRDDDQDREGDFCPQAPVG